MKDWKAQMGETTEMWPSDDLKKVITTGLCLVEGDAVHHATALPAQSIDLIITDPPYESLEKHRAVGTTTRLSHSKRSSNDWFQIFRNDRFPRLMEEFYRILKPNSHCYLFCDDETSDIIKPLASQVGFRYVKRLVWDKVNLGLGYHYRCRYEFVVFMEKGKRRLTDLSIPDVLEAKRIKSKDAYPAEKPEYLYRTFIIQSCPVGGVVYDPFCGSGTGGAAALRTGRKFLGVDVSKDAMAVATKRCGGIVA